jgi:cholesterol transport system auxiliary component
MTPPRPARLALTLPLALALGGCITLFPKTPPAQLYRFEATVAQAPPAAGPAVLVQANTLDFDPASAGDQMLTVSGDQVAYVAEARWASPASELFEAALAHGFDAGGGRVRLVQPGPSRAAYRLKLDVTRFEADYANGPGAPPNIVVHLHATLERQENLAVVAEEDIDENAPASENRVGSMVGAYDAATSKAVSDVVAWVAQNVGG